VCEGKKCYVVEIEFYWDLLGRYHHFDTLPGKGLTKLDHIPFTQSDYSRLDTLLRNPNSLLASYAREELVKKNRSSTIDGYTGATALELKKSIVDGAVYSCFALWHIVHGPVVDTLREVSISMFTKALVQKMMSRSDPEINYFLIENFTDEDFNSYLPEVLKSIRDGKGYYPKNAIEHIPDDLLCGSLSQAFFAAFYPRLDYFAKVALLESLNPKDLSEALKNTISKDVQDRDSYKSELISALLYQDRITSISGVSPL